MPALIYFYFYFGSPEFSITLVELSFPKLLHSIKIDEIDLKLLLIFFFLFFLALLTKANQTEMFHVHTCSFFHLVYSDWWLCFLLLLFYYHAYPFVVKYPAIFTVVFSYSSQKAHCLSVTNCKPFSFPSFSGALCGSSVLLQTKTFASFFPYSCHEVISVCDITVGCYGKSCDIWSRGL